MANSDILRAKIQIEDNFTLAINKLSNNLTKVENNFRRLSNTLDKNTTTIVKNINKIDQAMNKLGNTSSQVTSRISNALGNQAKNMEKEQEKSIKNIEKRYQQMANNINRSLSGINSGQNNNTGSGNSEGNRNRNNSNGGNSILGGLNLDNVLRNVFSGNFGAIIGKLSIVGTAIMGVQAITKLIDTSVNSGFEILNKATGNLFSMDGITNALQEAMSFESGKASLGVFFGDKADETYKMATKVANETFASEKDTISIASKLGQVGVSMTDAQMKSVLGVAATRPTVGIDHIGLAIQEAIDGRISMLKNYGINNFKLQDYYKYLQKNDKTQANALKGALNKKGTAGDAQKYFDLVVSYIDSPFSHMAGYADEYTKTLSGKLDRLQGLLYRAKAEIMGFDTNTGEVVKNGFMDKFGQAVDNLKNKLEQPETIEFMQKIGSAFGIVAQGLSEAFIKMMDNVDLESLAKSITNVANAIADAISKLVDSGMLEEFSKNLGDMAEKAIQYKSTEIMTDTQVKMDMAQGKWLQAGVDKISGTDRKIGNYIFGSGYGEWVDSMHETRDSVFSWFKNLFSNNEETTTNNIFNDYQLSSMIDNSDISTEQKQEVKNMIKEDDLATYNIHIDTITANNFPELINEIKQAQINKK